MPVPLDFGDPAAEREQAETLALCDVSALPRVTLKGPGAQTFLTEQGLPGLGEIYEWRPLAGGGLIVRTGAAEYSLEDGPGGDLLTRLDKAIENRKAKSENPVYRALRQDAAMLLPGRRAVEVLAQTCGYDFRGEAGSQSKIENQKSKMVMTRIAGVSCSVLPRQFNGIVAFQLWTDGSYGLYLWETLLEIVRELGGSVAGLSCFFPSLVSVVHRA